MKTTFTLFLAALLFAGAQSLKAQDAKTLLSQVAEGIKPEAFI